MDKPMMPPTQSYKISSVFAVYTFSSKFFRNMMNINCYCKFYLISQSFLISTQLTPYTTRSSAVTTLEEVDYVWLYSCSVVFHILQIY